MARNFERKYRQVIDYVENQVGTDIDRDLLKVAIGAQDTSGALDFNVEEIAGVSQSGGDLIAALQSTTDDDELRLRLFAEDESGNLAEIQGEELGTSLGGTETAVVTKMAEVLETVAGTEARVSIYAQDNAGNLSEIQAGPLDAAPGGAETAVMTVIARALSEVGNSEVRTRVLGEDNGGNLQEAQVEALDSGVSADTYAQLTYLARALNSQGLDEFVTRVADSTGSQIDPLGAGVTRSVDDDYLQSVFHGVDSAGTLQEAGVEAMDTGVPDATVAQLTYLARALRSQHLDELQTREVSDAASRFSHDDGYIRAGGTWHIQTGEEWEAGNVNVEGTLAVDGTVRTTEGVSGPGRVTGDGTITLVEY